MPAESRHGAITIDGPAASGKSSTAAMVAAALDAHHVDSGALYRAATAARLRLGGEPELWTEGSVLEAAHAAVSLRPRPGTMATCLFGVEAEDEIRGAPVTALVSMVARMGHVREWVNAQVRAAAAGRVVVCDGRDMGTAVFPDALLKVWLVALPEERARRRLRQRSGGAEPSAQALAEETAALEARDRADARQTQPAPDAVWLDTTGITQPEQVARIVAWARTRLGDGPNGSLTTV